MAERDDEIVLAVSADTSGAEKSFAALARQASGFSTAITGAFKAAVAGGRDFEAVLNTLALRIAGLAFDRALQPVGNLIGGAIERAFGLAAGGIVSGGRLKQFARGGIIAAPTVFPLGRGLGLAGEAGPEAVLPLARGSDGRLGVASGASRPVTVTVNVTTPDVEGFRKSEAQVTAMLARAVGRGRRGL